MNISEMIRDAVSKIPGIMRKDTASVPVEYRERCHLTRTADPSDVLEECIQHYQRPFDGTFVKAFEFCVDDGSPILALIQLAKETGYHVTHPVDGRSAFARSIEEVEAMLCIEHEYQWDNVPGFDEDGFVNYEL